MNSTEYFIYLLSCHLNAVEPKGEKRMDWQQIYNLAEKNNLTAIIAYEIKRLPADCRPGGTIGAWFNECFENAMHSFRPNLQSLSNFIGALTEKRISHVLFKGVILRNYYPFPELRVGTDMDVVIRPAEYINAVEVLKKKGFIEKTIESNSATLQFEKDVFELHTELESINIQSKIYFATPFDDISDSSGYTYKLNGFNMYDAVLTAPETRSSSSVRILRDEFCQCNISGVYPCGEGAGYAGGIVSAAVDGIKCAHAVLSDEH